MKLVLFVVNLFVVTKCAKILGVFPAQGYSQFILAEVLMKELANRGHSVTVIAPYNPKDAHENYTTILTDDIFTSGGDIEDLFGLEKEDLFTNIRTTYEFGYFLTETTLKNSHVQALLHSDSTFDLVIIEQFFNEAMMGFAHHFNAPLVMFSSMGIVEWNGHIMGNPFISSINPVCYTSHTSHMTFWQRSFNLIGTIYNHYYRNYFAFPIQKSFLEKYFPEPPNFDQILHNASLMLLNSHVTTSESSLLPYNMIEIGGFHVTQKPLEPQIKEFLDNAQDGVIFFSMGSNLKSADLSPNTVLALFRAFGKLKQKILWKFEKDFPNKPDNVFISKWFKQSDILGHPNIQIFITHGGLLSTTEAVFYGVPMIGIPIFGDQKMNMARARQNGIAKIVPFQELGEEILLEAISDILTDPKYHENARKLSNLMRDRVVRPLDLAMYWIEYVIRHKGARFETPTLKLSWFQFYSFDILVSLLLTLCIIVKCTCFALKTDNSKKIKKKQK